MLRALDGNAKMINFKITDKGSMIMLFYDDEIKIKEKFENDEKTRYLARGEDFISFFENPHNAYEDNIVDYDLKDEKLTCIFAENTRRFVLSANLETKEVTKLAEWKV